MLPPISNDKAMPAELLFARARADALADMRDEGMLSRRAGDHVTFLVGHEDSESTVVTVTAKVAGQPMVRLAVGSTTAGLDPDVAMAVSRALPVLASEAERRFAGEDVGDEVAVSVDGDAPVVLAVGLCLDGPSITISVGADLAVLDVNDLDELSDALMLAGAVGVAAEAGLLCCGP